MSKLVKLFIFILAVGVAFYLGKNAGQSRPFSGPTQLWEEKAVSLAPDLSVSAPSRTGGEEFGLVAEAPEVPEEGGSLSERLVIKNGQLSLLVADVRHSVEEITQLVEDEKGFVLSADVHKIRSEGEKLIGLVVIKIPSENFNQIFNRIKRLGLKVTAENISGQDVTEEYTDLQSRLRNLEAAESQLLELMKQAGKVTEILEVQKELVRTREQIERIRGRIEFLEKSAKMATITVNLATEGEELPVVEEDWRPRKVARAALRTLVRFWQGIGNGIIWVAVFFSPFAALAILLFLGRKIKSRGKS